jgi:tetratricopeptide (TPR) repeat protein
MPVIRGKISAVFVVVKDRILLGLVCALVLGIYAWTARPEVWQTAVWKVDNPAYNPANACYNLLVDGFRSGQLNLNTEVPSGLAKLADPYDPLANVHYRQDDGLQDISYYKNKLYLYFGVTPAVVLFWPYVALTSHYLLQKQAVAIFCAAGFLASVALLRALRRRYFSEVNGVVVAASALALGLATFVPVMLQRPDTWEVPISCAYAMVMLALLAIWQALHDPVRQCRCLAAASLAYGLAVGARPTVLFGAVVLLAPVIHAWISAPEHNQRWLAAVRLLAAAVVPISLVGAGLMLYNDRRFDNPFEFGLYYQLVGNQQHKMPHMLSLNYFWFNFQVYFLQPIHWSSSFPFVEGIKVPPAPAGQLGLEGPFGILPNIPLVWLALATPLAWQKRTPGESLALRLFVTTLAMLFGISALLICLYPGACARYEVDFMPALVLIAVCGVLGLERTLVAKPRWHRVARWAWITALLFSVAVSLLVCIQRYTEERSNTGVDQLNFGRPKEAVLCFEQALRVKPDDAEAHNNLGNALSQIPGRLSDAIAEFQTALRINPQAAETHYNLGNALLQIPGRLPDAIAEFQTALRLKPDYADAHNSLGNALLNLPGRWSDAISQFEAALRISPDSVEIHYNLGNVLSKIPGRLSEAITQYQAALRVNPDSAEAHANLGDALLKTPGRLSDAIAEYEAALHLKPEYAEAHNNLGNALLLVPDRLPDAMTEYETALRLKPDYAEAHYNLGNAFFQSNRFTEALGEYQSAIQLKPDYAEAHNNLGNTLAELGRLPEAIEQYKEALQINPDYENARQDLEQVQKAMAAIQHRTPNIEHPTSKAE